MSMNLGTLGFAMGSAWLSGINLYATVLMLGMLQRFNLAHCREISAILATPGCWRFPDPLSGAIHRRQNTSGRFGFWHWANILSVSPRARY